MGTKIANHSEPVWDANDSVIAREFETFRKRLAQPLCADDDFTVIEHAVELWKGGGRGRYFPPAKMAAQMAAALKRIAAP
jgi:hypothetical protein